MLKALIIIMVIATVIYEISEILLIEFAFSKVWFRVQQVSAYVNSIIFMIMPIFYRSKGIIIVFELIGLYWLWKSWYSRSYYMFKPSEEENEDEEKEE